MENYQSHKIVEAGKIVEFNGLPNEFVAVLEDGSDFRLSVEEGERFTNMASSAGEIVNGGYLVRYPDGYISWHPSDFLDHYDLVQPSSGKSKIAGYRELEEHELQLMNLIKEHGKQLGDLVENLRATEDLDQRWVSIGATELQQGLMALTRAVARPEFF